MIRCPHCGALARIEPSPALRWRCGVCGGPIVPAEGDTPRSDAELPNLVRSHRLRAMAVGWLGGFFVLGSIAAMATGTALLVALASHVAGAVLGLVAVAAAVLALGSLRRSRRHRAEAREELELAWEHVAAEVVASGHGTLTAAELARRMRTDEPHAETLLARLSARDGVRIAVRDDAELTYRTVEESDEADDPEIQRQERVR